MENVNDLHIYINNLPFSYNICYAGSGDGLGAPILWNDKSLKNFEGKPVRLPFN